MTSSYEPVVVLGAGGQLGTDLVRAARRRNLDVVGLSRDDTDVTNFAAVKSRIPQHETAVVINCAAYHNVDGCEEHPARAYATNAAGSLAAAEAADAVGARYVFVSTDYVFDGTKPHPRDGVVDANVAYGEEDEAKPRNTYGMSKLVGERLAAYGTKSSLIVRVAALFGAAGARGKGGNFVDRILQQAENGGPVRVVDDQWVSPTFTRDAADGILDLLDAGADETIVHATNTGGCTWHDLAIEAIRIVGLDTSVQAIKTSDYPSKARRPVNSTLANDRMADLTGTRPRRWQDALRAYLQERGRL